MGNRDIRKLSPGKVTLAGTKQVFGRADGRGVYQEDVIGCRDETMRGAHPLLEPVMVKGRRVDTAPTLNDIRQRAAAQLAGLDPHYKSVDRYETYPVRISPRLEALQS